jgi:hypothetical protein
VSRIAKVVSLLDEGIFVRISISGTGNLAQGIATLNGIAGDRWRIFSISPQQFHHDLLKALALTLSSPHGSLVDRVIKISGKILLDHDPPPEIIKMNLL